MTPTSHWRSGVAAALVLLVLGLMLGQPAYVLLATIPIGFVGYSHLSSASTTTVTLSRAVSDKQPQPGDDVTVTLTVENTGETPAADLQLRDTPPEGVPVSGPPELATALRPGESTTVEYTLNVPRGVHEFGDTVVRHQNFAGTAATQEMRSPDGVDTVICHTLLDAVPLQQETIQYVGRSPSDNAGSGVEFYGLREYHRGDPIGHIDWARYARTGDLTTVQFREHRSMIVVFVVDDRAEAQRARPAYGPDSLDLSVYAASRAVPTLLDDNHRVGVGLLSGLADISDTAFVAPGGGETTEAAAETTLHTASATESAADPTAVAQRLVTRIPTNAQVVLCTALVDDFAETFARELRAQSHAFTVLSPDMSPAESTLGSLAEAAGRETRIARLEQQGVAVVDWSLETPLAAALGRVFDTWGRTV